VQRLLAMFLVLLAAGCADAAASAPRAAQTPGAWDTTRAQRWSVELSSSATMAGVAAPLSFVLKAELRGSFRERAGQHEALLQLVEPALLDGAGRPLQGTEEALAELGKPFAVSLRDGRLSGYHDVPGASALTLGLTRTLAAALQRSQPTGSTAVRAREWDATGLAEVEYRVLPGPNTLGYRKLAYESVNTGTLQRRAGVKVSEQRPQVVSSDGKLVSDTAGIVSLERSEQLRVPLSADTQLSAQTRVRMTRLGFVPAASASDWDAALARAVARRVDEPLPQDQRGTDAARIGDRSFEQVVAELRALDAKGEDTANQAAARGPLFHALVGLYRQQPATCAQALSLVRGDASPSLRATLLDALAMASSVEAVRALEELTFDGRVPEELRARAASSLIRANQPGPEAFAVVQRMLAVPALWEHGVLGLGSFVRQLRARGATELADEGTRVLAAQLRGASKADTRKVVLLAIANSGSDALFDAALAHQKASDASERDAAIQAIRLMQRPEVEGALAALLAPGAAKADLLSALHALRRRSVKQGSTVARVEHVAREHIAADVRREAVLALGAWQKDWPHLSEVLREVGERESEPHVRAVAVPTEP
jgi:hypothetical protein